MARRKAAVLYTHSLFGAGIARLLKEDESLDVVVMDGRLPDIHERVRRLVPDVVVVERGTNETGVLDLFQDAPNVLVICVEVEDNVMDVLRSRRVLAASPDDLRAAVRTPRRRPRSRPCGSAAAGSPHPTERLSPERPP